MTGVISKFVLSVSVAGAGGTAIGIPLSSSSQSNSTNETVTVENSQAPIDSYRSGNEETTPSQDSVSATSTRETPSLTQAPEVQEVNSEGHQQLEETQSTVQSEGNCTVFEIKEEISKKLPISAGFYVSVSCHNNVEEGSMLSKWKGFFPTNLLKKGIENLKENTKLKIDVQEINIPDDDTDIEANETIFTSEQFLKTPLTGRWGTTPVEGTEDDENSIYVVNLSKSGISDSNFYILSE